MKSTSAAAQHPSTSETERPRLRARLLRCRRPPRLGAALPSGRAAVSRRGAGATGEMTTRALSPASRWALRRSSRARRTDPRQDGNRARGRHLAWSGLRPRSSPTGLPCISRAGRRASDARSSQGPAHHQAVHQSILPGAKTARPGPHWPHAGCPNQQR
eukprot:scaffold2840_cov379-Prasinococcus_capsulatus_cf.AAC.4